MSRMIPTGMVSYLTELRMLLLFKRKVQEGQTDRCFAALGMGKFKAGKNQLMMSENARSARWPNPSVTRTVEGYVPLLAGIALI